MSNPNEIESESIIYGLLRNPYSGRFLTVRPSSDEGWRLPTISVKGRDLLLTPGFVTQEMSQLLGQYVIAYRYFRIQHNSQSGRKEAFFELECPQSSVGGVNLNAQWSDSEELLSLHLEHNDILVDYLLEAESKGVPEYRQPWERSGWYTKATSWTEDSLRTLGIQLTERPEQVKWWSLSCVMRLSTTHGIIYFKTNAHQPLFAQEPTFLTYMAKILPGSVPQILASELTEGWMLLADAGDKLSSDIPMEQKVNLLLAFGEIQLEMVCRTTEILELGCSDRKPDNLLPLVEQLFEDAIVVSKLTRDELEDLRRHLPTIMDMCKQISSYSVPSTLVHGDLHMGNVASGGDGLLKFFDWTDACVAHPFMDMTLIYHEKDLSVRVLLRDAYLELWKGYETMERLQELWSLCEVVHTIYHTVSYQSILKHTEVRSRGELGGVPAIYMRNLLRYLNEG
jgi:hypothetical protein